jgi:hypothetical protein
MQFMILDSSGSAVASLDDELAARAMIHAIVAVDPDAADHLLLLAYDDVGMPVGEAMTVWDVPPAVTVDPSDFVQRTVSQTLVRLGSRAQTKYIAGMMIPSWQARIQDAPAAS